jgi:hypothetical protein
MSTHGRFMAITLNRLDANHEGGLWEQGATFTVNSNTQVAATVPAEAITASIHITTKQDEVYGELG